MALSGSTWIDFRGSAWRNGDETLSSPTANDRWDAAFDLTQVLKHDKDLRTQIQSGDIAFDNQRFFARLQQLCWKSGLAATPSHWTRTRSAIYSAGPLNVVSARQLRREGDPKPGSRIELKSA